MCIYSSITQNPLFSYEFPPLTDEEGEECRYSLSDAHLPQLVQLPLEPPRVRE